MNLEDTLKKIKELDMREQELKRKLNDTKEESDDLFTLLNTCAIFDESLIQVIAELMSIKEQEDYIPFMYKNYSSVFVDADYVVQNTCIGITKKENLSMFKENKNTEELFQENYVYDMICLKTEVVNKEKDNSYIGIYDISRNYDRKAFTFEFLLKDFDVLTEGYPFRICKYSFDEYSYIQEYIRRLFDLQIQRKGKKLNYEEMKKVMFDFIDMKITKSKTKTLSNGSY